MKTTATTEFKVWKTIQIGTGLKTANDFRRQIIQAGMDIGNKAGEILENPAFKVSTEKEEVDLVVPSVAELGFDFMPVRVDVYKRALDIGLSLCPIEVGPQLRIRYSNQPINEEIIVAMEPVTWDRYRPFANLFVVGRGEYCWDIGRTDNGCPWLDAKNEDYLFRGPRARARHTRLVFVLPRKQERQ